MAKRRTQMVRNCEEKIIIVNITDGATPKRTQLIRLLAVSRTLSGLEMR